MTDTVAEPLASPDPATTAWVPMGPQGAIGPQGPAGPQGAQGPQGPAGSGIPTPVVNGQWIKGVGGAAVWAPITQDDITSAWLGRNAAGTSDWNTATKSGWYMGANVANAPSTDWWIGQVYNHRDDGLYCVQVVYGMTQNPAPVRFRWRGGGAWSAWSAGPAVPACAVYRSSSCGVSPSTWSAVVFEGRVDGIDYVSGNMWDGSTALYAPVTGRYWVSGRVRWAYDNNGTRYLALGRSGGIIIQDNRPGSGGDRDGPIVQWFNRMYNFTAGDYAQLYVQHDSSSLSSVHPGDALQTRGGDYDINLAMSFIGPS